MYDAVLKMALLRILTALGPLAVRAEDSFRPEDN
jgi:hypothetical protein